MMGAVQSGLHDSQEPALDVKRALPRIDSGLGATVWSPSQAPTPSP